jgi:glycosyltransferase involved in cell wall biosynthesis
LFAKFWSANLVLHLKKLDKLVVLTEKDREAWTELSNVKVIPNPLSFTPHNISTQTNKRVIAVARYSHEKGIDLLLKAWAITEKETEEWRLDIYGDGNRESFEQLIDLLGIDRKRCALHGRTNIVEQEFVNSSLFVLSSRFEGFGMVILEAMACGLPVVAFDCPWGPRSIVTEGKDGLLAENGNVNELSDGLFQLMNNDSLRLLMSKGCLNKVNQYKIEIIAGKWREIFNEVL